MISVLVMYLHNFIDNLQKIQQQNTAAGLRTCNNILAMTLVRGSNCNFGDTLELFCS